MTAYPKKPTKENSAPVIRGLAGLAWRTCCAALILSLSAVGVPSALAQEAGEGTTLGGYLKLHEDWRWAEWYPTGNPIAVTSKDRDLFTQMRLDALLGQEHAYEFHFHGAVRGDLDGVSSQTGYAPLEDIGDSGQRDWRASLYEAHLDLNHPAGMLSQLRVGRQALARENFVYFDGLGADLWLGSKLSASLYGGSPVRFYELAPAGGQPPRDSMAGLAMDYTPAALSRLSLDYLRMRDQQDPFGAEQDSLVALGWQQRISSTWKANIRARGINGEGRDVRLRALGAVFSDALVMSLNYLRQMRPQNELSTDLALCTTVIGQSEPYHTLDLKLRASLGDNVSLDLGLLRRELLDPSQESPLNRSYARYFTVLDWNHLFFSGLSLSLTGERWSSKERSVEAGGLDLGYRQGTRREALRLNVGTYYSLYKYDYYALLGERNRTRTYYAKAQVPVGAGFSLDAQYEYEYQRDVDAYRTARAGVRYDF